MGNAISQSFPIKKSLPLERLRGHTIAIDIAPWIYKSIYGAPLSTIAGGANKITAHLYKILELVETLKRERINVIICLDSISPRIKSSTVDKRLESRKKTLATLTLKRASNTITSAGLKTLRMVEILSSPTIRRAMFEDLVKVLTLGSIPHIQVPQVEGEQLCTWLCKSGVASGVLSPDRDVCLYGIDLITKIDVKNRSYELIPSEENFLAMGLKSLKELQLCAILSGTDYHPGLRGVGPVGALNLVKSKELQEIHKRCEEEGVPFTQIYEYLRQEPVVSSVVKEPFDPTTFKVFLEELGFASRTINRLLIGLSDAPMIKLISKKLSRVSRGGG